MIAEHAAVYLDALTVTGVTVRDQPVDPEQPPDLPYLVVYISVTTPEATSLEETADRVQADAIVHAVGLTTDSCRVVTGLVWSALLGLRPQITARDCGPIRLIDDRPADADQSTGRAVLDEVTVWRFVSLPA
ncbi:hypothetical protein [Actinoplanes sp. NPDC051851]|uniref:hypothetical protein n=1 Tax=Actinoplanes sp. NPDC051851 TaxID=3154753 RepID=UPI003443BA62